jgi:hypothetical protein
MSTPRHIGISATVVSLALAACAVGSGSTSELTQPPDSGNPSAGPTWAPTSDVRPSAAWSTKPEPSADHKAFPPDTIVQVTATDLVIRSAPGINAASDILAPRLSAPQLLYVASGPVPADGYQWYLVRMFWMDHLPHGPETGGWVAAGSRDGEPWIAATHLDCPAPTLDAISGMHAVARLACFRGQTLTLEGNDGGCFQADPVTVTPGWLSASGCALNPDGYADGVTPGTGQLIVRQSPTIVWTGYQPGSVGRVIVTGQFDDPAAQTCSVSPLMGSDEQIPELLVLTCRTEFAGVEMRAAD